MLPWVKFRALRGTTGGEYHSRRGINAEFPADSCAHEVNPRKGFIGFIGCGKELCFRE